MLEVRLALKRLECLVPTLRVYIDLDLKPLDIGFYFNPRIRVLGFP